MHQNQERKGEGGGDPQKVFVDAVSSVIYHQDKYRYGV